MTGAPTPAELFGLDGKVVILTGASSGLGARWAPVVAAAGAQIVVTARREAELDAVAAGIPGAVAIAGDVTDAGHCERLVGETLERFGHVDVLVNNAGTAASAPALDTSADDLRALLEVDLTSVFVLSRLAARAMIDGNGGSIVNVSSLGAERSLDRFPLSIYNAAKAGVVSLTRSFAEEWGRHGVRVNAVGPAFFPTRLDGFLEDADLAEWVAQHTALKRVARIDELDGMIVFLASDASSFVTGQHLLVDGGWSVY